MTPPVCCPPPVLSSSSEPLDRSRDLLNCLAEPRGQSPASRGTPRSSSDWGEVLALATLHDVAPLLYERLANNTSPDVVPSDAGASCQYHGQPLTPTLSPSAGAREDRRQYVDFPLTPALSPSAGEREDRRQYVDFPLAPAEGERVGVRGELVVVSRYPPATSSSACAKSIS